jgi:hypothetical protein
VRERRRVGLDWKSGGIEGDFDWEMVEREPNVQHT